jgi:hypothetical protein
MGEWKLIRWYEDDRVELYNLAGDTGELKNLAAAEPARATELQAALEAWLQSTNSIMPVPNPDYDAARETEGLPEAVREQLRKGELPTPAPTH